ncbi:MAG TPA: amidohydrolase family protein [Candidatus Acidoferrales bacterium]|nr:amidohydrolase family protein [Candidatus Acidoferrales bacterium]
MWNGYRVVDADAHMHEPKDMWDRYVEPEYRARAPKVAYMSGTFMVYQPDGKIVPGDEKQLKGPPKDSFKIMEEKYGEAYRTWWAPQTRLKDMDRFGWDIQVLLPTGSNGNFGCTVALKDAELGAALCRAYNNWARDYCSADSKRLKFIAVIPGSDAASMVAEARRAAAGLGAVSVRNPLLPEGKWLHEREYDALWRLASDLDFPVAVHGEYRYRVQPFRGFRALEAAGAEESAQHDFQALRGVDHAIGFPCDNMATLAHFIFTGILERFPKLRLAILESNAGWLPFWLGRMDVHSHGRYSIMGKPKNLTMLPSEYFLRQCAVACDSDEPALKYAVEHLKGENIVWNTDYPHLDGIRPERALPEFAAQPISEEAKRKILWDNAVKLYGPRLLGAAP